MAYYPIRYANQAYKDRITSQPVFFTGRLNMKSDVIICPIFTLKHKNYMDTFECKLIKSKEVQPINWIFLPRGPGLGSQTLLPLIEELELDGKCWCFYLG